MCQRELVAAGKHSVSKMPCRDIPADVDQTVDDENPGERDVVVPSPHAISHRAGGFPGDAPIREFEDRRVALVPGMPPVELGEIQEDVDAADQQIAARDDADPVANADVVRVEGDPLLGSGTKAFLGHVIAQQTSPVPRSPILAATSWCPRLSSPTSTPTELPRQPPPHGRRGE